MLYSVTSSNLFPAKCLWGFDRLRLSVVQRSPARCKAKLVEKISVSYMLAKEAMSFIGLATIYSFDKSKS